MESGNLRYINRSFAGQDGTDLPLQSCGVGAEELSASVTSAWEWTAKPAERLMKRTLTKRSADGFVTDKTCQINFPSNMRRFPRNIFKQPISSLSQD